jgi:hypothetical protein
LIWITRSAAPVELPLARRHFISKEVRVSYPEFFEQVARIVLRDPLSAFLGASPAVAWSPATSTP